MKQMILSLVGACAAFCSLAETNAAVQPAASEVRTFRLQYASAAEVAGQINELMSGETAVIGGMSHTTEQDIEDGIPYLRAIPWVGKWLFGSTTKSKVREDILVFVTVGEVDPEGVKGTTGAPASSEAARKYPEGLDTNAKPEPKQ